MGQIRDIEDIFNISDAQLKQAKNLRKGNRNQTCVYTAGPNVDLVAKRCAYFKEFLVFTSTLENIDTEYFDKIPKNMVGMDFYANSANSHALDSHCIFSRKRVQKLLFAKNRSIHELALEWREWYDNYLSKNKVGNKVNITDKMLKTIDNKKKIFKNKEKEVRDNYKRDLYIIEYPNNWDNVAHFKTRAECMKFLIKLGKKFDCPMYY